VAAAVERGDFAGLGGRELRAKIEEITKESAVYLRPETAQAMFVQFLNVQQSMSMKVPFGIAQMGKSFRNEITVEHFIFRSCEFEQMEMEFFCEPGTDDEWMTYWSEARIAWWKKFSNDPSKFRLRAHEKSELAHYAKGCFDVEYLYPWGWGELEGIANRTDYDLKQARRTLGRQDSTTSILKPRSASCPTSSSPPPAPPAACWCTWSTPTRENVPGAKGEDATRVVLQAAPPARAHQGRRHAPGQEGRHAREGPRSGRAVLPPRHQRQVRRAARHRQALPAARRNRHALVPDD
jgi:hypothetical protein